jgi:ABC-type Fe3+ transport system permease subunit
MITVPAKETVGKDKSVLGAMLNVALYCAANRSIGQQAAENFCLADPTEVWFSMFTVRLTLLSLFFSLVCGVFFAGAIDTYRFIGELCL